MRRHAPAHRIFGTGLASGQSARRLRSSLPVASRAQARTTHLRHPHLPFSSPWLQRLRMRSNNGSPLQPTATTASFPRNGSSMAYSREKCKGGAKTSGETGACPRRGNRDLSLRTEMGASLTLTRHQLSSPGFFSVKMSIGYPSSKILPSALTRNRLRGISRRHGPHHEAEHKQRYTLASICTSH